MRGRRAGGGYEVRERRAEGAERLYFKKSSFWGVIESRFYALFGRFLNFEEYSKLLDLKKSQVRELGKLLKIK